MIELDSDISKKMIKLKKAMADASNGKEIKRELSKKLRSIMNPIVQQQRAKLLGLPSKGHDGPSLRQAIARQTKAATRYSGRNAGIQIIQRSRAMPRDFRMAGRMFNREEGWNPTTLGGERIHQEIRPAQWFDGPTKSRSPEVRQQLVRALDEAADRIAAKAH